MGCKTSKVHVEVYRVGMDLTTYYDLRVFPKMRTMLFSVNSECKPQGVGPQPTCSTPGPTPRVAECVVWGVKTAACLFPFCGCGPSTPDAVWHVPKVHCETEAQAE